MNIFLAITKIMILAPLKPYILPLLEHFLALKTQTFRNGLSVPPQMAYRS